jgi:multiple sugar transport system permease protein
MVGITNKTKTLYIGPTVFILMFVMIYPFFYAIYLSFLSKNLTLPTQTGFVGFKNYVEVLTEERPLNALKITFEFVVSTVGLQFLLGLPIAYILRKTFGNSSLVMTALLIPILIPKVAVGYIWLLIYHPFLGIANYFLGLLSITPLSWTASRFLALPSVIIVDLWQWLPFMILIALAGMETVPETCEEAAALDGANEFQKFFYVFVPLVMPIYLIGLLFRLIEALRTFNLIYVMTHGGPGTATETVDIYTYIVGIAQGGEISHACALSLILLAITIILATILVKKGL